MSQQPVTRVTTEAVKAAIEQYVNERSDRFTTADIARFMGIDEYPVRAAMTWLTRYGFVEIIPEVRSRRYLPKQDDRRWHCDTYSVSMYRVKEKASQADFTALMGVFCRG